MPLFSEQKILNVGQIYNLNCAKFTFCSLNKTKYSEFNDRLATNGSFHNYPTRSSKSLRKPRVRLQKFMNSFLNHGIEMWNNLPDCIKNVKLLATFKRNTKNYILKKCKLCKQKEIGDEFHYLFTCTFFTTFRNKYIDKYYYTDPNKEKMAQLLNSQIYTEMLYLVKFKEIILKYVKDM